jgi:hypothetical protein
MLMQWDIKEQHLEVTLSFNCVVYWLNTKQQIAHKKHCSETCKTYSLLILLKGSDDSVRVMLKHAIL